MGKVSQFAILFDKEDGVFFPGQQVPGNVALQLTDEMKIREIRLKFHGIAKVRWTEGSGDNRKTRSSHEDYFHDILPLFNSRIAGSTDDPVLPVGRHIYPFFYTIPQDIPSSYEGKYGSVRYYASCTIDVAWDFDPKCKSLFTVISTYDLNTIPYAKEPVYLEDEKTLCCCCCEEGPIVCRANIPKKGYVPGEAIPLDIEVSNKANSSMESCYAVLHEHTTFSTRGHSKNTHREIARVDFGSVGGNETRTIREPRMIVPPCVSTDLPYCNRISVDYVLQATVRPSGMGLNLDLSFPIIIGTVPIWSSFGMTAPPPPPQPPPPLQVGFSTDALPPPYESQMTPPGFAPPSYESCVFGSVDARDDDDNDNTTGNYNAYTPRYPVYNTLTEPSAPPLARV